MSYGRHVSRRRSTRLFIVASWLRDVALENSKAVNGVTSGNFRQTIKCRPTGFRSCRVVVAPLRRRRIDSPEIRVLSVELLGADTFRVLVRIVLGSENLTVIQCP